MRRLTRSIAELQSIRDELQSDGINATMSLVLIGWLNMIIGTLKQIEIVLPATLASRKLKPLVPQERTAMLIRQINDELRDEQEGGK